MKKMMCSDTDFVESPFIIVFSSHANSKNRKIIDKNKRFVRFVDKKWSAKGKEKIIE